MDEGDSSEDVTLKINSRLFTLCRVYSSSLLNIAGLLVWISDVKRVVKYQCSNFLFLTIMLHLSNHIAMSQSRNHVTVG